MEEHSSSRSSRKLFSQKLRLLSAEALLGNGITVVDAELFWLFRALQNFASVATGVEHVDLAEVAEHAVGLFGSLRGKVVRVVGSGNIGSLVTKRLEAFGCEFSYNSRAEKPAASSYTFYSSSRELEANRDAVVFLCCSLSDENEPHVQAELFGLDSVALTPQIAVFTPESFMATAELAIANLEAFFRQQAFVHLCISQLA